MGLALDLASALRDQYAHQALAVSQAIARAHGGEIVAEPLEPGGACFVLCLPRPKGGTT
jgi:K+-sensing histidine kinase KdpD